jgi:hypothetical protein
MWNIAVGLFWVALLVGLYIWSCPLPELKKPEDDGLKESAQP